MESAWQPPSSRPPTPGPPSGVLAEFTDLRGGAGGGGVLFLRELEAKHVYGPLKFLLFLLYYD